MGEIQWTSDQPCWLTRCYVSLPLSLAAYRHWWIGACSLKKVGSLALLRILYLCDSKSSTKERGYPAEHWCTAAQDGQSSACLLVYNGHCITSLNIQQI